MHFFKFFILSTFLIFSIFSEESPDLNQFTINPNALKPGWWSYYDVEPDVLQKRAALTEEYFSKLNNIANSPEVTSLESEFLMNIRTLCNIKKNKNPPLEEKRITKNTYPFEEWFQNVKILRKNLIKLHDLENEETYDEQALRKSENEINDFFIKYLAMDDKLKSKHLVGLQIMLKKSTSAIDKVNINLLKTQILELKKQVNEIKDLVDVDPIKVEFSGVSLKNINVSISENEQRLLKTNEDLTQIKTDFQKRLLEGSLSDIKKDIFDQRLIHQKSLLAQYEIKLINLNLIKSIVTKAEAIPDTKTLSFSEELEKWENKLEEIKTNVHVWAKSSQKELTRAIETLSIKKDDDIYQSLLEESKETLFITQKIQQEQFLSNALINILNSLHYLKNGSLFDWAIYQKDHIPIYMGKTFAFLEKTLFSIGETPVNSYGILRFLLIMLIFYGIGLQAKKNIVKFGYKQKKIQAAGIYTLSRLVFYLFLICGTLLAFSSTGISLTTFNFIAGALGIGIGFGLQSIFNNFISGILILLEKNIRIGDVLELESGEIGTVIEINVRNTLLASFDGIDILVPNSEFITKKISNRTLLDKTRRLHIPFSVSYETDKDFLKKILIEEINEVPMTLNEVGKEAQLWLVNFGESRLEFEIVVWVNEYINFKRDMSIRPYYSWLIHTILQKHRIEISYPKNDVYLHYPPN